MRKLNKQLCLIALVIGIFITHKGFANHEEFVHAIESNNQTEVTRIITSGMIKPYEIIQVRKGIVGTPLILAIEFSNIEMVRLLIRLGCQPNSMVEGQLPLHCAARQGNLDIVKMLINEFNSDPRALSGLGHGEELALHIAASCHHLHVVEYLLDLAPETINSVSSRGDSYGSTPLLCVMNQLTSSTQNITLIEFLLEQGAELNSNRQSDYTGNSFLHLACAIGHVELVRLIINHSSFNHSLINSVNQLNQTPLQVATDKGYSEIAELLKGQGGVTLFQVLSTL